MDYTVIDGVRFRLVSETWGPISPDETQWTVQIYHKGVRSGTKIICVQNDDNVYALINHWNRCQSPHYLFYV